jgi:hypothetical protein
MKPIAALNSLPGEPPGAKIARLVRKYEGCSSSTRRAELGALVARGVDRPESVVDIRTNCGMFALGIFAAAGVEHPLLDRPYVSGMAISWLRQIGLQRKALQRYTGVTGPAPKVGSLLRYVSPTPTGGKPPNNDHVEFLLGPISMQGTALHGGGGRAGNAITVGTGPVLWSAGRPLVEFWDPDLLGIEELLSSSDMNEAIP